MLATKCSNLLKLDCTARFLSRSEAAACLRLLPSTLESSSLDTTLGLNPDPNLQRMQHLTCLSLTGTRVAEDDPVLSATGLQGLRSLQAFKVECSPDDEAGSLDAATFTHSSLTRLELAEGLFQQRVDLAGLPALHTISIFHSMQLPRWLLEQPFPRLEPWDAHWLDDCGLDKLLCNQLMFICGQGEPGWAISSFLEMPRLQQLETTVYDEQESDNWETPLKMHGSCANYQLLLQRADLKLEYPVELELSSLRMPLCKRGHALVCTCSVCLSETRQAVCKGVPLE